MHYSAQNFACGWCAGSLCVQPRSGCRADWAGPCVSWGSLGAPEQSDQHVSIPWTAFNRTAQYRVGVGLFCVVQKSSIHRSRLSPHLGNFCLERWKFLLVLGQKGMLSLELKQALAVPGLRKGEPEKALRRRHLSQSSPQPLLAFVGNSVTFTLNSVMKFN